MKSFCQKSAIQLSLVSLLALGSVACVSTSPAVSTPAPQDGLVKVATSEVDHLWIKPNTNFSAYNAIMLDGLSVDFNEQAYRFWRVSDQEKYQRLAGTAKELYNNFPKFFLQKIEEEGRYQVASQKGPHVLQLTPALADVYITNPGERYVGKNTTIVSGSAGNMTLIMEVRDSVSGELIAQFEDYEEAENMYRLERQNKTTNQFYGRIIMKAWARDLSDGLLDNAGKSSGK